MVAPLKLVAPSSKKDNKLIYMGKKYYYCILPYIKNPYYLFQRALMNNSPPFATWTKSFLHEIVMQPESAQYICLCVYGFARERGQMQNFIKNKQEKRGSTASTPPLISRKFQLYSLSSPINLDERACALNKSMHFFSILCII